MIQPTPILAQVWAKTPMEKIDSLIADDAKEKSMIIEMIDRIRYLSAELETIEIQDSITEIKACVNDAKKEVDYLKSSLLQIRGKVGFRLSLENQLKQSFNQENNK